MYRVLENQDGVIGYRLSGTLTDKEVKEIQREVESIADEHGRVRMLCEMGDFSRAEPAAIWQDLKFTPQYAENLEKFAVVGDKRWHEWVTKLADAAMPIESRYFEASELDQAWDWVRR